MGRPHEGRDGPNRFQSADMNLSRIWAAVRGMLGESELKAFIGTWTNLNPSTPSRARRIPSGVWALRTSGRPNADAKDRHAYHV